MNSGTSDPVFDLKEWRERFIRVVLRLATALGIIMLAVSFPTATTADRLLFIILYLVLAIITILHTPYTLRVYLLLAMTAIIGINAILAWGPWADGSIFLLATVVLASLLLDERVDIAILAVGILFSSSIAVFTELGAYTLRAPAVPDTVPLDWGVYIADFSIIGVIITAAANMLKNAFIKTTRKTQSAFQALSTERLSLENAVRERAAELETHMTQLRASTNTARAITGTQEISGLLKKTADLIAEQFEYYHVGVFILDEQRKTAYLEATSSETGKSLLGQAFRVEPDRKNPLSLAMENRQPVITSDLDKARFYHDDNFPLTRSRMAMPLSVRGSLIGIIDIHSDQPRAFTPQDAEILQTLTDLTAIAYDNVRLLDENRNLLSQLETTSSYQTQKTWSKFTSRQKNAYLYTPAGVRPVFSREKTESSEGIHIPIVLQGQSIGRINLKRKGPNAQWSERERDLVEKVATQVALALENSRLVDEAQKNALRNQMIANFSTYVRETLDVEVVIRSAATELRKVFDLKEAEVLIGFEQAETFQQP